MTAGAMVTQAVASDALQVMGSPADAHPHDFPSLSQGSSVADAYLAPSALTQATPPEVVGGSSEGGPQLPLSAFPNIAPNDLALLHALGVTSAVPAASGSSMLFLRRSITAPTSKRQALRSRTMHRPQRMRGQRIGAKHSACYCHGSRPSRRTGAQCSRGDGRRTGVPGR